MVKEWIDMADYEVLGSTIVRDLVRGEEGGPPATVTPPPSPVRPARFVDVMKRRYGPLPVWGWGLGAAGLLAAYAIFFRPRRTGYFY